MTVFSGSTTSGAVLQTGTDNPSTLVAGGYIGNTTGRYGGDAVYGKNNYAWTFSNYGTINATQAGSLGIAFEDGGTITNAAGGVIGGAFGGAEIFGGRGEIVNFGTIGVADPAANGKNSLATDMRRGGVLINGAATATNALIFGGSYSQAAYFGNFRAAYGASAAGTVVNYGTIASQRYTGVVMSQGGTVINSGSIVSAAGWAIYIRYGQVKNDQDALIAGAGYGVRSFSGIGGAVTVTNDGTIAGTGAGVDLVVGGLVGNGPSGLITGNIIGGAPGTVVNYGTIASTGFSGVSFAAGGYIANQVGALIQGVGATSPMNERDAIDILGAAGTVVNSGKVNGTGFSGSGIVFRAGGTVSNAAGATVSGYFDGIYIAGGAGVVINSGTITATTRHDGITLLAGGAVTNAAGGLIHGAHNGVYLYKTAVAATVTNNAGAFITGVATGVSVAANDTATNTIVNYGTITGTGASGVGVNASGTALTMVHNYGTISGASAGVRLGGGGLITNGSAGIIYGGASNAVSSSVAGTGMTVVNFGTMTNASSVNPVIYFGHGGTLTNGAGAFPNALIVGPRGAVSFGTVAGAVLNLGTILSTSTTVGSGIYLGAGGTVKNGAGGLIEAYLNTVSINRSAGTVLNSGTIAHLGVGTIGEAVYLGHGGLIVNYTGALISGARVGAPGTTGPDPGYPGVVETGTAAAATVVNLGTIINPNNSDGVNLLGGGLLINGSEEDHYALISAFHDGVYIGGRLGVPTSGALGTVVNYGTIANFSSLGVDVELVSGGTVTNSGLIASGRTGVSFHNMPGTLYNFGTIVSTAPTTFNHGYAVYLQHGGFVRNEASGLITAARGAVELGVALTGSGTTTESATFFNAGIIVGSAGISVGAYDTASNTIINAGTIIGINGTAIALRNNNNIVELLPGSYIQGNVDGGGGSGDVLELGSGSGTGIVGTGVQFTNFASGSEISVDPGADWMIDGPRNLASGVTIVDAGYLSFFGDVNTYGMLLVQQGGVARYADIANGGIETVASGGSDIDGAIDGGGTQLVFGAATGTEIDSGGGQDVAPGGVTFDVVVDTGGLQTVLGTASGTVLDGGAQVLGQNNATRFAGADFGQGGAEELAVNTTVSSGGAQTVLPGGIASATTVSAGGDETVTAGGTMVGATIVGGVLDLQDGSVAAGTIGFSGFAGAGGGRLEIDGTTMPTTPIGGFVYGDTIDLTGLAYSTAISATIQNGTLDVTSSGTVVDQLTVNGIATGTQFTVSSDGAAGGTAIGRAVPKLAFMTGSYDPWSISPTDPGSPESAMNTAFGTGNWVKFQGFTGSALTAGYQFIYIDGGDGTAGQFDTFVNTYRSALQTFVTDGGTLFINAARWQSVVPASDYSFNLGFGGVTLTHSYSNIGNALQPTNPVFSGPNGSAGTYWNGHYFSHDIVSGDGLNNLIEASGGVALAGENYGSGYVMFGGMTSPYFDFGTPEQGDILRANILDYIEGGGTIGVPAPTDLALSPASESGVAGSNDTNITAPVITGDGVGGDTVTVFDGTTAVGTGTVGAGGTWAVTTSMLTNGVHSITATETASNGAVSPSSAALSLTINTTPPQTTAASLSVSSAAGATLIGIAAPTDLDPAGALTVTVDTLPTNGTVTLADGQTAVTVGEQLTVAQLTGLDFTPNAADNETSSDLVYTVTDRAGNAAVGTATLSVNGATLYQFLFTYNDGKDYFEGTVADSGNFGYKAGETIQTSAGAYSILSNLGSTGEASGTVFVTDYFHNGPGEASTTPVDTAAGQPDSTTGLGNVSDFVLGLDGLEHPFSGSSEANFVSNALYGFVFNYTDGREYYSGTVAAALGSTPSVPTSPIGSYSIFFEGLTASAPGSVSVDRFVVGSNSFIPGTSGGNGIPDGTGGLGSEIDSIEVNGATSFFSDTLEPTVYLATPTIVQATPPTSDSVYTSEVYDLYSDILNRVPDQAGLNAYTADLANGESISTLRALFANSAEAQMDLNTLYNIVFSRNIDASGIATYTNLLADGSSLSAIQLLIGQSPEAQADIQTLYEQVLDRSADPAGLVNATAFLAGGGSLDAIRLIFAHSQEAAGDLSSIFQSTLGRGPDAAELAGMEDQLALNGASQSTVVPGDGVTKVVPPAGSQTLTAASGTPTEFDFSNVSFTNDTISGFAPTIDALVLPTALAGAYTHNASGSSTLIGFSGDPSQSILLSGVSNNSFGSTNVRFA